MPRADAVVKSILRIERRSPLSVFVITDSLTVSSPDISKALSGEVADFGIGRFDISLSDLQKFNVTLAANIQKIKDGRQFRKSSWNAVVVVMSDDMTFLELFGVAAKNGRVLSGTTRLLVITNLTLKQISWLMDNNWTYAMMNSMFVNLESNANNIR
ncbi:hypothetical protein SK128_008144 [Halocaridina rubra]|uniref:Uncharacterized protein n=1 Tax=Halocaridina rubra TaxID=373956 RepID=A0AAN9AGL7_HALRR